MIWRNFRQAMPAALLVWSCQTLCAISLAWPWAAAVPTPPSNETTAVRALVLVIGMFEHRDVLGWRTATVPLTVMLLTGPFWRVFWMRATHQAESLAVSGAFAAVRYRAAWGITLVCGAYVLLSCAAAAGAAVSVYRGSRFSHDERAQFLAALAAAALFTPVLLHAITWLDSAHARLADALGPDTARAALSQALRATGPRLMLWRATFGIGAALLAGCGLLASRLAFGITPAGSVATLVTSQLIALQAALLRGIWFAVLMRRRDQPT